VRPAPKASPDDVCSTLRGSVPCHNLTWPNGNVHAALAARRHQDLIHHRWVGAALKAYRFKPVWTYPLLQELAGGHTLPRQVSGVLLVR
jgi:hypothetical protein